MPKLPDDSEIDPRKATEYLLVKQARGDKSEYLARAGYALENADVFLRDLREQILPLEAVEQEENAFGRYFAISGVLKGPNGREIAVATIWMRDHLSGRTKFITLYPPRRT